MHISSRGITPDCRVTMSFVQRRSTLSADSSAAEWLWVGKPREWKILTQQGAGTLTYT